MNAVFKRTSISVLLIGFAVLFATSGSVFSHGEEEHEDLFLRIAVCQTVSDQGKSACYADLCEADETILKCVEDIVDTALASQDADSVVEILYDLENIPVFSPYIYEGAKRMGNRLVLEYGTNADVFAQCSSDFRYGCIDGFFESAVASSPRTRIGEGVCATAGDVNARIHCYHRMGHAFMKNVNYVYEDALLLCDTVSVDHIADCWDGVFMEGVHQQIDKGDVALFDAVGDILAPCSSMDERYLESCYKNHGLYLTQAFGGNQERAMEVCAQAGDYSSVCIESVMGGGHGGDHKFFVVDAHSQDHNDTKGEGMDMDSHKDYDSAMDGSVVSAEDNRTIDSILVAYIVAFLLSIVFLAVSVKKKSGVFPIMKNTGGVYGFVDKVVLLSYVLVIGNTILYVSNGISVYESLDSMSVKIGGLVVVALGLLCMFIAQKQMGKNWRIGIDEEHKTDIVETGFFRFFRHPIYFFAVLITIGMVLVIPALSSIFILVLLWVALSVQSRLEETFFLEKHGGKYEKFMQTRKRWFS